MKAFLLNSYGKKEKLHLTEITRPTIQDDQVLVEIHAAALNPLDSKIKNGDLKLVLPYKPPFTLGHDVAGVIIEVGKNIKSFKIGDEVYARPADFKAGTLTEYIAIQESDLALKPNNLSFEEAASIPLVALTAWQALIEKANLQKDQKVFIQAGSGGVGTIAIQLAKNLGATVATTASPGSFEMLKNLGADILIDYKTQDFETILKDYDLVLNTQDIKELEKSINITKPGGKVISITAPPTPDFAIQVGAPWFIKIIMNLMSSSIRRKSKKKNIEYIFLFMKANGHQLSQITKLIESGSIKPVLDKVFSFEQTNEALEYLERGHAKGKVVIKIK